jgi:YidC/Oxa1 family membrane protein insertase
MTMQQRILLALAICAAILFGAELLFPKPKPVDEPADAVETKEAKDSKERPREEADAKPPEPTPAEVAAARPEIAIETHELRNDLLALTVTNRAPARDGLIAGLHLLSPQFAGHDTATNALGLGDRRTLEVGLADEESDVRVPAGTAYEVREAGPSVFVVAHRDGEVEIEERLELLAGYEARLHVRVTNHSSAPQVHRLGVRTMVGLGSDSQYDVRRGLCRTLDDLEDEDKGDVEDGPVRYTEGIRWSGVDTKYFTTLVVPETPMSDCEIALDEDAGVLSNRMRAAKQELPPGESASYVFGMYLGPKELERLRDFGALSTPTSLEDAIDWGFFGGLSEALGKLLLGLMRWFFALVQSWGFAIVLLTIVVKLATLPLTLKQMSSMKRMKEIQPEMAKIKEKYKEDRVKQGQEIQALFARSGVNPLAGCLPMLVQLPVWFALYSMLGAAVQLVHEPFLWLPDLTKQDPYYVLPLALGALMILQNRMMPSMGGDETQQKLMRWVMPVMFTVFMLFLPSGLGVYIFANIVLSIIQTGIQVGTKKKAEPAAS